MRGKTLDKLLYIHGFNATGTAVKAMTMKRCLNDYETISPTLDYYTMSPNEVMRRLKDIIDTQRPRLTIGSSLGAYYSIACSATLGIPVVALNPTTNPIPLVEELTKNAGSPESLSLALEQLDHYKKFQTEVFEKAIPESRNLNFALATDDELLGSHSYLEKRYPAHNQILYMDHCGHHFTRFEEIIPWIRDILTS